MKAVRILATYHNEELRRFEVVKEITNDDDSVELNLHVFPESCLEWKAAEYNIDAVDDVIDVILFEPFEDPVDHMSMSAEEARTKHLSKVLQRKQALGSDKKANQVSARAKLTDAGVHDKYVAATANDPYEVIRTHAPFDAKAIAARRLAVHKSRTSSAKVKEERVKERLAGTVRQQAARKQLFRQGNMRREGQRQQP